MLPRPQIVNPHLLKDLTERGLWSDAMKNQLIAHNGSIQVERHTETGQMCLLCIGNKNVLLW